MSKPLAAQAGAVGQGRVEPKLAGNVNRFGEVVRATVGGLLAQKFYYPPFSVLSAREGLWQERKRQWLGLGIKSELGRGEALLYGTQPFKDTKEEVAAAAGGQKEIVNLKKLSRAAPGGSAMPAMNYKAGQRGDSHGRAVTMRGNVQTGQTLADGTRLDRGVSATSVFDPVLCELAYTWWCPAGGSVLDPFAGGSVRGVVAALLGLKYRGHELSAAQVEANREQAKLLCKDAPHQPVWVQGDSRETLRSVAPADFILSCPPYGDLERYSDDPQDLSTMPYPEFLEGYREVIARACAALRPGALACWVIGEYRDKQGNYVGFLADTVQAFRDAGLALYNDAVLLTAVGSLPVRTSAQFESGRKLGKAHQNILVFIKPEGK